MALDGFTGNAMWQAPIHRIKAISPPTLLIRLNAPSRLRCL